MSEIDELRRRVERLEQSMWPLQNPQPWMSTTPPGFEPTYQCPVCKIEFKGAFGYVCANTKCPYGVSSMNTTAQGRAV